MESAKTVLHSSPVGDSRSLTPLAGEVTVVTEPVTNHIASLISTSLRTVEEDQGLAEGSVVGPIEEPHPTTRNDWTDITVRGHFYSYQFRMVVVMCLSSSL